MAAMQQNRPKAIFFIQLSRLFVVETQTGRMRSLPHVDLPVISAEMFFADFAEAIVNLFCRWNRYHGLWVFKQHAGHVFYERLEEVRRRKKLWDAKTQVGHCNPFTAHWYVGKAGLTGSK